MRIAWGSLKLQLALAGAVLIALSVGLTVLNAVLEMRSRAEQTIVESNLDADKIAAALSNLVIERQLALAAVARTWSAAAGADGEHKTEFQATKLVLEALFDEVRIVDGTAVAAASISSGNAGAPTLRRGDPGPARIDVAVALDGPASTPGASLVGSLHVGGHNFVTAASQSSSYETGGIRTFVVRQDGTVLAAPNPQQLLKRVDDDPQLQPSVARWRAQGSPLEPAPWADRIGGQFHAMAAVPGTDWLVFRVADVEHLFGRASQSVAHTIVLGSAVGLIGAALLFAITARFLRPMEMLQRRALLALVPSQPPSEGWPAARGEIGELARILRHVSEQAAAGRDAVEQALRRMEIILALAPAGIAFTSETRIELSSRQLEHLLGYGAGEQRERVAARRVIA